MSIKIRGESRRTNKYKLICGKRHVTSTKTKWTIIRSECVKREVPMLAITNKCSGPILALWNSDSQRNDGILKKFDRWLLSVVYRRGNMCLIKNLQRLQRPTSLKSLIDRRRAQRRTERSGKSMINVLNTYVHCIHRNTRILINGKIYERQ